MQLSPAKIVFFFMSLLVLMNPPLVLGLLGSEGRRAGMLIDENLGTDSMRIAVFGRR
ncbi:hypothetical protein ACJ4V0_10910 [Phreatobacter sp. HK31-P]|nr:hypothetical protein [Phreatobacter sp.]